MTYIQLIPSPTQSGGRKSLKPTANLGENGLLILNKASINLLGEPTKVIVLVDTDNHAIRLQPTTPDDSGAFALSAGGQASARIYLKKLVNENPDMVGEYSVSKGNKYLQLRKEK